MCAFALTFRAAGKSQNSSSPRRDPLPSTMTRFPDVNPPADSARFSNTLPSLVSRRLLTVVFLGCGTGQIPVAGLCMTVIRLAPAQCLGPHARGAQSELLGNLTSNKNSKRQFLFYLDGLHHTTIATLLIAGKLSPPMLHHTGNFV